MRWCTSRPFVTARWIGQSVHTTRAASAAVSLSSLSIIRLHVALRRKFFIANTLSVWPRYSAWKRSPQLQNNLKSKALVLLLVPYVAFTIADSSYGLLISSSTRSHYLRCLHGLVVDGLELHITRRSHVSILNALGRNDNTYNTRVALGGMRPGKPLAPYA